VCKQNVFAVHTHRAQPTSSSRLDGLKIALELDTIAQNARHQRRYHHDESTLRIRVVSHGLRKVSVRHWSKGARRLGSYSTPPKDDAIAALKR